MEEKDIYDLEVERLQAIPTEEFGQEIFNAWVYGPKHSCLFDLVGATGEDKDQCIKDDLGRESGCLTQIRLNSYDSFNAFIHGKVDEELTDQIRSDPRIPSNHNGITKENLSVFAEYQRKVKFLENNQLVS